jgi:hypothetical protein
MSLLSRLAVQAARAYGILSSKSTNVSASYLAVAGGGGGGDFIGGGGGAGGFRTGTSSLTLSTLNTYTVTVGSGGAGGGPSSPYNGSNGSNSVISGTGLTTITSTGGGGGGSYNSPNAGSAGGSGGGGSAVNYAGGTGNTPSTSPSQGNNGGAGDPFGTNSGAGGGGGANAVGGVGAASQGGAGGAGTASSISGSSITYAGGGGGGGYAGAGGAGGSGGGGAGAVGAPTAGTVNTGGGGGGNGNGSNAGAAGGSGIVIISYTSATPKFVGGTLTTSGGNQIHTFTSSGTLSPLTPVTASYLVVAGGGSGGSSDGGGGGAGGLLTSSTTIYSGATYVVTVGAGGAARSAGGIGNSGSNSSLAGTGLTTITSTGGGGGGYTSATGAAGGSGGGSSYGQASGGAGTSGQGNNGGGALTGVPYYGMSGGGGAGAVGGNGTNSAGGAGGAGSASSISGSSVTYAGGGGGAQGGSLNNAALGAGGTGGGGAAGNSNIPATAGTVNTGGGGGGGGFSVISGAGGSGTVIISYAGSQVFNGGLVTSSGGNTIHTFNATGALTPLTNNLNNSLRFRSSASAYLSRTPTVAGSKTTWTWSAWVKRGAISATSSIFSAGSGANISELYFTSGNILRFYDYISSAYATNLETTQLFRDPSAWYHITVVYDTTQATAANRVRLYVNGNQVTSFGSTTYPAQNYASGIINSTTASAIGGNAGTGYFDGYLTDINFIDGQALEPYYFGNNDSYGNWKPIKYTGMYGTNGFYLTFGNTTSTTTLGYDSSPNGNNWTTNNISLTAGTTYDAMLDVPTNTSATVANYAVLNPVYKSSSQPTISNGNLTVAPSAAAYQNSFSTIGITSGKFYAEITITGTPNSANIWGMSNAAQVNAMTTTAGIIGDAIGGLGYGYYYNGSKYSNGTLTAYGASLASGDVVGIAYDADGGSLTFYKNGTSQGVAYTGIDASTVWFFGATSYTGGSTSYNFNFGQRPFSYTPPSGYVALNTYNLPTPTILKGNLYMDATTYTGTGTALNVVNQGQFKPDLVWIKSRNDTQYNVLQNSNTGAGKTLFSNTTGAETGNAGDFISSFNSNGFTVNTTYLGGTNNTVDTLNNTYVGWQWQAGQGSSSSNTSGSITSTVSASTTAGFSIVTYTGTGANATVGHGLGVAPKMIIIKSRSAVANWPVYHSSLTSAAYYLRLDLTNAQANTANLWNSTVPTSSVFSLGNDSTPNTNGATYVAYCWAEIAGFSKFTSYTGNNSNDGPFVYCGFRPKFVMIKDANTNGAWIILDSNRATYNVAAPFLQPNITAAETTAYNQLDFLSNGFKLRADNANAGQNNVNGNTYIVMAFAENPFKNANAR